MVKTRNCYVLSWASRREWGEQGLESLGELQEPPAPSGNAREGQERGDEQHKGSCKGCGKDPCKA